MRIQITKKLLETLKQKKSYGKQSYEEVIWDLIEDTQEVNQETKIAIEQARADIKAGRFYTYAQIKKELRR